MSETSETLAFFAEGWQNYQKHLSKALARLTPEQLALRAAPNLTFHRRVGVPYHCGAGRVVPLSVGRGRGGVARVYHVGGA